MRGVKYPVEVRRDEVGFENGNAFCTVSRTWSLNEVYSSNMARRIAACLNACRDISTEDLEKFGGEEQAFRRNWMLRQAFQDLLFVSSNDMEGE